MSLSVSRHRRSRRAGWIVAVGVSLAVLSGAAAAYLGVTNGGGCARPAVTLTVAASPDQFPVLSAAADEWSASRPTVAGRCAEVAVHEVAPSQVATALGPAWDEQRDGPQPDVWVPDSTAWLIVAGIRPDAGLLLPTSPPPRLASSPVVLAMQQPMAEALGWPDRALGWTDLLGAFAREQTWEQFGHPDWGRLRLGIAEPTRSTAGLAGVLTALDIDNDNTLSDQELLGGIVFSQMITAQEADTSALLRRYIEGDPQAGPVELPAAFPVVERDLAVHAAGDPAVPLIPIYPREGLVFADYPYTVLQAPWVDDERRQLAELFLAHLQSPAGRQAYRDAGFRDPAGTGHDTTLLSPTRGFQRQPAVPSRVADARALGELIGMWSVLQRPNNVLVALDTSGSMNEAVPGTDTTRLELLQRAAIEGIALLTNHTVVGLWEFSHELTGTTDYRELVPVGVAGEDLGGITRRQAMVGAIQGLRANSGTGLYDTVHDAYLAMSEAWQPDAQNLLVVITDGRNEKEGGLTLPELTGALAEAVRPDRPLPMIAIAVGPEADAASLEAIAEVTGGRVFVARDEVSAIQQVVLAFAGRIS